tara:strand:- start:152 stop:1144 length:993 start_codon:yes stop_codon:yes gene_type:complete
MIKKSILKKLFIRISKILGYEIVDQNEFNSPTLDKKLNENLSNLNKSIVLPLGEVNLSRKIKSILILFRTNTDIDIWDQNKKRIFEFPKIEYAIRSLNSLVKSIKYLKKNRNNIEINIKIIDSSSKEENLKKIQNIISKSNLTIDIISHSNQIYRDVIKKQSNEQTFSNLSSLLKCFEIGKKEGKDLVFFVEDDYLHFEPMLEEMVVSYERISSQTEKELFMCPTDYPYLYMNNIKTNVLIGNKRHWRTVDKTLCTFLTSVDLINKYWDNFNNTCIDRNDPFERHLNIIYKNEICISPLKSLSLHMTNINSSYGLSPFIDYKGLWDEHEV